MSDLPIGSVIAFAGQADPITGPANAVWANSGCGSNDPQPGGEDPNGPITHLEASGWMVCDGRVLAVSQYPELYAVLGDLYGQGAAEGGAAGFVIPDYRGLFLRGADAGAGLDPQAGERLSPTGLGTGNVVGSLQCDALQDHTHDYNAAATSTTSNAGQAAALATTARATTSPNAPAWVSSETRPKNVAVSYIIKFR